MMSLREVKELTDLCVMKETKLLMITLENDKIIGQCKDEDNELIFYCFSLYLVL
jgi:hypothetical protein